MTKNPAIDDVIAAYKQDISGLEAAIAVQKARLHSSPMLPRFCDPEHAEYYRCLQDFANGHNQPSAVIGGQRTTSARLLYGALLLSAARWADAPTSDPWSLRSRAGQTKWRALLAAAHSGLISACLAPHMVDAFHDRLSSYRRESGRSGHIDELARRDSLVRVLLKHPAVMPSPSQSTLVRSELGASVHAAGMLSSPPAPGATGDTPIRIAAYPFLEELWPIYLEMMLNGTCGPRDTPPIWLQLKEAAPAVYVQTARLLEVGLTPWIPIGASIPDTVLAVLPRKAHMTACTTSTSNIPSTHHTAP